MTYNRPMMNREQLADLLKGIDVAAVAKEAAVSTKTIRRLQSLSNSPNMSTVERLVAAVKRVGKRKADKVAA